MCSSLHCFRGTLGLAGARVRPENWWGRSSGCPGDAQLELRGYCAVKRRLLCRACLAFVWQQDASEDASLGRCLPWVEGQMPQGSTAETGEVPAADGHGPV